MSARRHHHNPNNQWAFRDTTTPRLNGTRCAATPFTPRTSVRSNGLFATVSTNIQPAAKTPAMDFGIKPIDTPQTAPIAVVATNVEAATPFVGPRLSPKEPGAKLFQTPQRALPHYLLPTRDGADKPLLTLILDLDETLVSNRRLDLTEAILRPYVLEALAAMRHIPDIEIVLWTASTEETGGPVVKQLEKNGRIFDQVIFRNSMWFTEPWHTKDLRLLGRDMNNVIVVDNAPNCVKLNRHNALLVEDFTGVATDCDATLINVYQIVKTIAAGCREAQTATATIARLSNENEYCREVNLPLPQAWQQINLRDVSPLQVPPHGLFHRVASWHQ